MVSFCAPHTTFPCPSPFNLAQYVLAAGQKTPDKTALMILGQSRSQSWTYAKLTQAVCGIATGLRGLGLQSGDRVLLRLGNDVDFPLAFLGAIAAGLVPVPTSSQLTKGEINLIADDVEPALVIAGRGLTLPDHPAQVIDTDHLHAFHRLPPSDFQMGEPNRPAYIVFTSGTSGTPRGVIHAHRAIWARRMMFEGWEGLTKDDRLLHAGAFNWTYTLGTGLLDPWTLAATALIPASGIGIDRIAVLLNRYNASIFAAAPGVYRKLLKSPHLDVAQLRHGLCAGEKLPESLRQKWETATQTPLFEAFGMSECSTFISGSPAKPAPPNTLGYPQQGRNVAIVNAQGPVPMGQTGMIAIDRNDPGVMLGYLNAAQDTQNRFQDQWFLTGDVGSMSQDGAITYHGRDDDMMNAGGYRVSPIEVESAFNTHPHIQECAAVELPVRSDASVIGLFYVSDQALDEADIKAYLQERLAHYKCPRLITPVSSLPRGGNNKLLRRALRQSWEAENGQT
ncbi:class I adenylate-forming enzyme family protein [Aestuariibius sp. HNIBRBA575]|uniref:class I adenylate-forming enzyme family protein n=1 Tax=Aestuariibius sp. HNIBRBA575 TaxID=3233343 RepID=UPI0034A4750C